MKEEYEGKGGCETCKYDSFCTIKDSGNQRALVLNEDGHCQLYKPEAPSRQAAAKNKR